MVTLLSNAMRSVSTQGNSISVSRNFWRTFTKKQMSNMGFVVPDLARLNQEIDERATIDLDRTLGFYATSGPHGQNGASNVTFELIAKRYFSSEKIPFEGALYRRGLKELTSLHHYIKTGNIRELLAEVSAERDPEFRIEWLKKNLKTYPHPLLYIELYRSLCTEILMKKDPAKMKKLSAQALAFYVVGLNLIAADCNCCAVPFQEPVKIPEYVHNAVYGDKQYEKEFVEQIKKEHIYLLKNIKNLPSPTWVCKKENIEPLPSEEWEAQRKTLLESIFVKKEGSDKS